MSTKRGFIFLVLSFLIVFSFGFSAQTDNELVTLNSVSDITYIVFSDDDVVVSTNELGTNNVSLISYSDPWNEEDTRDIFYPNGVFSLDLGDYFSCGKSNSGDLVCERKNDSLDDYIDFYNTKFFTAKIPSEISSLSGVLVDDMSLSDPVSVTYTTLTIDSEDYVTFDISSFMDGDIDVIFEGASNNESVGYSKHMLNNPNVQFTQVKLDAGNYTLFATGTSPFSISFTPEGLNFRTSEDNSGQFINDTFELKSESYLTLAYTSGVEHIYLSRYFSQDEFFSTGSRVINRDNRRSLLFDPQSGENVTLCELTKSEFINQKYPLEPADIDACPVHLTESNFTYVTSSSTDFNVFYTKDILGSSNYVDLKNDYKKDYYPLTYTLNLSKGIYQFYFDNTNSDYRIYIDSILSYTGSGDTNFKAFSLDKDYSLVSIYFEEGDKANRDLYLSKFKSYNIDTDMPLEISIEDSRDHQFLYSLCDGKRDFDCEFFLDNTSRSNFFMPFGSQNVSVDMNLSNKFGSNITLFDDIDFKFSLSLNSDPENGYPTKFNYWDNEYYLLVGNFKKDNGGLVKKIDVNWSQTTTSGNDCDAGYHNKNGLYSDSSVTMDVSNQANDFNLYNDMQLYFNRVFFKKCSDGTWVDIQPAYNFYKESDYERMGALNNATSCYVDHSRNEKDFVLTRKSFQEEKSSSYPYNSKGRDYEFLKVNDISYSKDNIDRDYAVNDGEFVNWHYCDTNEWISSNYVNAKFLSNVSKALGWNNYEIYCDWTASLDLWNLSQDTSNIFYTYFPQACVLSNGEDSVVSLLSNFKNFNLNGDNEFNNVVVNIDDSFFRNKPDLELYHPNGKYNFDFLLVSKSSFSDTVKQGFSSSDEGILSKISAFFVSIWRSLTGTEVKELYLPKGDYHALYYNVFDSKIVSAFAKPTNYDFNVNSELTNVNYTVGLNITGFTEDEISDLDSTLFSKNDHPNLQYVGDLTDEDIGYENDGSTIYYGVKNVELEDYDFFFDYLITRLRFENE